ncbi:MAG: hypothetical protein M1829_000048 [Trizodia sp. TS-e1964]|nr:MAG: hypothetical protein M1829_000048 [Trizodia sp. TS-e1964]
MRVTQALAISLSLPIAHAADTVLGVFIFSRHGDRTSKSNPPANLTALGYQQIYTSGQYFHQRYIASNSSSQIYGISPEIIKASQITVDAPNDLVLDNSAQGFLQGLYSPVGSLSTETLRNGTVINAPLNGYQLVPVYIGEAGTGSEDNAWLQSASGCANAQTSSNSYFASNEYLTLSKSTADFYKKYVPVVAGTIPEANVNYKNAYIVWDQVNVAEIHNKTFPSSDNITPDVFFQGRTLADAHEWGLAYNASDNARSVPGMVAAGQILNKFQAIINSNGKSKLSIQFGAYASFLSFFGLAQLPAVEPNFYGIPDYASTMTFELFTSVAPSPFPAAKDLQVRFLFQNGTAANYPGTAPAPYPLFGQKNLAMPWTDFLEQMNKIAVVDTASWCNVCGNSTGICSPAALSGNYSTSSSQATGDGSGTGTGTGGGMTKVVAGVIGAMVTLAVILGAEALIMLVLGLRLVRRKRAGSLHSDGSAVASGGKAPA